MLVCYSQCQSKTKGEEKRGNEDALKKLPIQMIYLCAKRIRHAQNVYETHLTSKSMYQTYLTH